MKKIFLFLAAFGLTACATTSVLTRAQREELTQQFDDGRVSQADIDGFLADHRSPKTAQAEAITPPPAAKVDQPLPPDTYRVSVVCDLPAAISAGKFDWVNKDITLQNFPEAGCKPGQTEVTLVDLGEVTTEQAPAELDKRGFKPAALPELLALAVAQPELQRQFYIVALGSVWRGPDGGLDAPFLRERGGGRSLGLDWGDPDGRWGSGGRFLALLRK